MRGNVFVIRHIIKINFFDNLSGKIRALIINNNDMINKIKFMNRFDNLSAVFRTSGENVFRCNVMWNVWNHGERAQWLGTRLSLFMSNWAGGPEVLRTSDGRTIEIDTDYWKLLPEAMRYDSGHGGSHPFLTYEFISAILEDREPAVNVYEAVAMTAPGIVATESARRGGERLRVPSFDRGGKTHG